MRQRMMVLAVTLAIVAAACGGGGGGSGVPSLEDAAALAAEGVAAGGEEATNGDIDGEAALLAFTQCLRDQGIDVADPEVDADGNLRLSGRPGNEGDAFDREAFQAARRECADILEGISLGFRDVDRTAIEDTLVAYAACMRENGYEMADPDFSGSGPGGGDGGGPFGTVDREDPGFISASAACEEILGSAFGPGGGPGGGPGAAPNDGNS